MSSRVSTSFLKQCWDKVASQQSRTNNTITDEFTMLFIGELDYTPMALKKFVFLEE